jgi:hypothetical protein
VLLQALLDCSVITQLLSAKAGGIARAGLLLLGRTRVRALRESHGHFGKKNREDQNPLQHLKPSHRPQPAPSNGGGHDEFSNDKIDNRIPTRWFQIATVTINYFAISLDVARP